MRTTASLPLAVQWLMRDLGLSAQELAERAGVPPVSLAAFTTRPHAPTVGWLQLLAGLGAGVELRTAQRIIGINLPRITKRMQDQALAAWSEHRLSAFRAQVRTQSPQKTTAEIDTIARGYLASSLARSGDQLAAARLRLAATRIESPVAGLRSAVRLVADAAAIPIDDLALLAGGRRQMAQVAVQARDDGRLTIPHRLCSAMAARLVVHPPGGGAVEIALCPPGPWRPEVRTGSNCLPVEDIRRRRAAGETLAAIARIAGVSRQRIHAILQAVPGG